MRLDQRDALWSTRHRLIKQDVAWEWPATNARRAREPGHTRMQMILRFPRQDHGMTRWGGVPSGLLGQSDGLGEMTNERPQKDKHLSFLTLRVNFITEFHTSATVGAQTPLGGCRECLPV